MSKANGEWATATQRGDAFDKAHFKCSRALGLSLAISARYDEAFEAVKAQPPAERALYLPQLAELLVQGIKATDKAIMAVGEYVLAADNAPSWCTEGLNIEHMRSAFFSMRENRNKFFKSL